MRQPVEQLTLNDFEEATDLLNYVFSQAHGPHAFEELLPKLYRPTEERMRCNYGIRHRGLLVAIAGAYPLAWQVGAATLRVAGIAGVATHPRHRGKGLMRAVVSHCVAEALFPFQKMTYPVQSARRSADGGWTRHRVSAGSGSEPGTHQAVQSPSAAHVDGDFPESPPPDLPRPLTL
jgi:GNAT superfamily N-acetyltransferase